MNNYPHNLTLRGAIKHKDLPDALRRRYSEGPYSPCSRFSAWRRVHVSQPDKNLIRIWESGGGLVPGPSKTAAFLALEFPSLSARDENELHPGTPPSWLERKHSMHFALAPSLQAPFHSKFVQSIDPFLHSHFPLTLASGATVVLEQVAVVPPELGAGATAQSYKALVSVRLGLTFPPDSAASVRSSTFVLANFETLPSSGVFLYRGNPQHWAADEHGMEVQTAMSALLRDFALYLNGLDISALQSKTPARLFREALRAGA